MIVAELEKASKRYGSVEALKGVSLAASEGEIVAMLGPNGAGKSTAISVLLGLRRPDSGEARIFGANPRRPTARRALGVTPQETNFPPTLRVHELIGLVRAHYAAPIRADAIYERFGLERLADRQFGGLSGGERRRVGVALAFAGDPRLIVLDEPTTGLDRDARLGVWGAIRAHAAGGGTILLTTHYLEEAEALSERVILIEAGSIVADSSLEQIRAASGFAVVRFRGASGARIDGAEVDGRFLRIYTPDAGATVERLVRDGHRLAGLEVRPVSLEEALASRRSPR
jgi:ABC-2 type transport system ATP-binding protein